LSADLQARLGQLVHLLVGGDPFPHLVSPLDVIPSEIHQPLHVAESQLLHALALKVVEACSAVGPDRRHEIRPLSKCRRADNLQGDCTSRQNEHGHGHCHFPEEMLLSHTTAPYFVLAEVMC
jgi:hypothetical protein